MTVFDQSLPLRVSAEARQIHFGRLLATALAGLFYVIGWSVAKVFAVAWFALAWVFAAVRLGWRDGIRKPASDDRS